MNKDAFVSAFTLTLMLQLLSAIPEVSRDVPERVTGQQDPEYFWDATGDADYLALDDKISISDTLYKDPFINSSLLKTSQPTTNFESDLHFPASFFHTPSNFWKNTFPVSPVSIKSQNEAHSAISTLKPHISALTFQSPESSKDQTTKTFNVIITKDFKNSESDDSNLIESMLLNTLSRSIQSPQRLRDNVRSALIEAFGSERPIQEAFAQIVEEPGRFPYLTVLNSTIPHKDELEATINTLLGSNVIYGENRTDNTIIGIVPKSSGSIIESILNRTIGIGHINATSTTQTNVVNLYIINILETASPIQNLQENKQPSTIANTKFHGTLDWPEIPFIEPSNTPNHQSTNNNLTLFHKFLQSFWNVSDHYERPTISNFNIHDSPFVSPLPKLPTYSKEENILRKPSNPYGLNLNENTILDLLPNFVRATTIPPIVSLMDPNIQETLGKKPSVLGLLPNQLFSVSIPKVHSIGNYTYGGIVRKEYTHNGTHSGETLFGRKAGLVDNHFLLNDSKSDLPVILNNPIHSILENYGYDLEKSDVKNESSSVVTVLPTHQPEADLNLFSNLNILDIVKKPFAATFNNKTKQTLNSRLKTLKKNLTLKNLENLVGLGNSSDKQILDNLVKAVALGAVPGGLAFATALFPYWAPLVFGRRRKRNVGVDSKRSKISIESAREFFYDQHFKSLRNTGIQARKADFRKSPFIKKLEKQRSFRENSSYTGISDKVALETLNFFRRKANFSNSYLFNQVSGFKMLLTRPTCHNNSCTNSTRYKRSNRISTVYYPELLQALRQAQNPHTNTIYLVPAKTPSVSDLPQKPHTNTINLVPAKTPSVSDLPQKPHTNTIYLVPAKTPSVSDLPQKPVTYEPPKNFPQRLYLLTLLPEGSTNKNTNHGINTTRISNIYQGQFSTPRPNKISLPANALNNANDILQGTINNRFNIQSNLVPNLEGLPLYHNFEPNTIIRNNQMIVNPIRNITNKHTNSLNGFYAVSSGDRINNHGPKRFWINNGIVTYLDELPQVSTPKTISGNIYGYYKPVSYVSGSNFNLRDYRKNYANEINSTLHSPYILVQADDSKYTLSSGNSEELPSNSYFQIISIADPMIDLDFLGQMDTTSTPRTTTVSNFQIPVRDLGIFSSSSSSSSSTSNSTSSSDSTVNDSWPYAITFGPISGILLWIAYFVLIAVIPIALPFIIGGSSEREKRSTNPSWDQEAIFRMFNSAIAKYSS